VPVGKRVPVASRVAAWIAAAWMACRAAAAKVNREEFLLAHPPICGGCALL